jgi:hypothetical protein
MVTVITTVIPVAYGVRYVDIYRLGRKAGKVRSVYWCRTQIFYILS